MECSEKTLTWAESVRLSNSVKVRQCVMLATSQKVVKDKNVEMFRVGFEMLKNLSWKIVKDCQATVVAQWLEHFARKARGPGFESRSHPCLVAFLQFSLSYQHLKVFSEHIIHMICLIPGIYGKTTSS